MSMTSSEAIGRARSHVMARGKLGEISPGPRR